MGETRTTTDRHKLKADAHDVVRQLRVWGTNEAFELPASARELVVGSARTCAVRIHESCVSREHLRLTYADGKWSLVDLSSKNGTYLDGMAVESCALVPGAELRLGLVTMIADSMRLIELRELIGRLLGWSDLAAVDQALRSIRRAVQGRSVLYLSGADDLALVAYSLHRRVMGAERPFVMCDPRRRARGSTVRSVANRPKGLDGYRVAKGGTLCLRAERLPQDFEVLLSLHAEGAEPQVMIVVVGDVERRHAVDVAMNPPVCVPPISRRAADLSEIVDNYARDAAAELSLPALLAEDRAWVLKHAASSFAEIEKGTRRVMAIRGSASLSAAAARLDMAAISLRRWLDRRGTPSSVARLFR